MLTVQRWISHACKCALPERARLSSESGTFMGFNESAQSVHPVGLLLIVHVFVAFIPVAKLGSTSRAIGNACSGRVLRVDKDY